MNLRYVNINLELSDLCNMRCIMCQQHLTPLSVHGSGFRGTFLSEENLSKILLMMRDSKLEIACLSPFWLGEATFHPHFNSSLFLIFEENKKNNLFKRFILNTNGLNFGEEAAKNFLDYASYLEKANLHESALNIIFSLDAASKHSYGRVKGIHERNFEKVIRNIHYLIKMRSDLKLRMPNLTFQFIVMKENQFEARKFVSYWKHFLNDFGVQCDVVSDIAYPKEKDQIFLRVEDDARPHFVKKNVQRHKNIIKGLGILEKTERKNNAENKDDYYNKKNNVRRPCFQLWNMCIVSASGIVIPCCKDAFYELTIGSINESSLDDLWLGEKIKEIRLKQIKGEFNNFRICASCTNSPGGYLSDEEVIEYLKTISKPQLISNYLKRVGKHEQTFGSSKAQLVDSIKICLVSREYPLETGWGGIGTYTYHLAHGLAKLGHQVHVIAQSLDTDKDYFDGDIHVYRIAHKTIFPLKGRLREFALRFEYSQSVYRKLQQIIVNYNIDIVEAPNLSGEGFIYSWRKKVPLVTRLHTHFSEVMQFLGWKKTLDRYLSCWFENIAVLRSDLVICSTHAHTELIAREVGMKNGRVKIIPLGVPLPRIEPATAKGGDLTVLFVGRLEKRKGIHMLVKAMPAVINEFPNVRFVIIGRDSFVTENEVAFSGSKMRSFKSRLLDMIPGECKASVTFLDYVSSEELDRHYRQCDIFVAPSLYESFGFIYIEAMSYAKPVIGCGVGGVPEVIKDKETGFLVPPEDPQRLAEAILTLLRNPDLRITMGLNARKHVEQNFTLEHMAKNTETAYKEAIKRYADSSSRS